MRAESGDAALEVAVESRLEGGEGRRLAVVAQLGGRQPELAGALGEAGPEQGERFLAGGHERGAELGHLLRPRRNRVARGEARTRTAKRRVPLRDGAAVVGGQLRPRRREPGECAIEI